MVYFLCKAYDSDRQNCYFAQSLPVRGAWIEIRRHMRLRTEERPSLPVRGAWIEMRNRVLTFAEASASLPVRGAWIEMSIFIISSSGTSSLPVRGAWIEISRVLILSIVSVVAPRAGSVD